MPAGSEKVDLIVFGATGFAGKFVIKELANLQSQYPPFTFGIAGRSASKLHTVLSEIYDDTPDVSKIPVLEADVDNPASLTKMAQSTRVLINCVGPYRFYGEPVVVACIAAGTDYVDISGEPQFVEKMYLKYHQRAVEKNVIVLSTCGFDSVPADLGVLYTLSQLEDNVQISSIESFIELESKTGSSFKVHHMTLESAVYSIAHQSELRDLRKQIRYPKLPIFGPKLQRRILPSYEPRLRKWTLMFPGSDASVVRRTQLALMNENNYHPTQYSAYFVLSSIWKVFGMFMFGAVFVMMSKLKFGRSLLLKYPEIFTAGVFSRAGPSQVQIDSTFVKMTFFATALPKEDNDAKPLKLTTRITTPEPAYVTTSICVTQAALCILASKGKSLEKVGVLTPGAAFYKTDYISRLQSHGVRMTVVEKARTI